jgi:hypothetical protein
MTDMDKVRAELESLEDENGLIMPEAVVEFAKDPKTALHSRFEWNDSEAAHQYRVEQARRLIRVFVTVETVAETPVRAFVSLPSDRKAGGGYRSMPAVMSDEERYRELLQCALADLRAFQTRYRAIKELEPVLREAEKVERDHGVKVVGVVARAAAI